MKKRLSSFILLGSILACQGADSFEVHEWGTFTSLQHSDGKQLMWLSTPTEDLPDFIYKDINLLSTLKKTQSSYLLAKGQSRAKLRMETPVIYFHSDKARKVNVQVDLPKGRLTEWYPVAAAAGPAITGTNAYIGNNGFGDVTNPAYLKWDNIQIHAPNYEATLIKGDRGSHYYDARATTANLVSVPSHKGTETEGFLFYRGVAHFDSPVTVTENEQGFLYMKNSLEVAIDNEAALIAQQFDTRLRAVWPKAEVGFTVLPQTLQCPSPINGSSPEATLFLQNNLQFLCSTTNTPVYSKAGHLSYGQAVAPQKVTTPAWEPPGTGDASSSSTLPRQADFRSIVEGQSQGILSRFLQNELSTLTWYRPEKSPDYVFGAQINPTAIKTLLGDTAFRETALSLLSTWLEPHPELLSEIRIQVLDDRGNPVGIGSNDKDTDWKRPFVSAEISESLPHWEIAAYLSNTGSLAASSINAKWRLGSIIAFLALAMTTGCILILRQVQRQLLIARQKTDFVSNVSHELKTPLTSIRMFSELLSNEQETTPEKRSQFLSIIQSETARLTRLINNVLDFSRMEKKERPFDLLPLDLRDVIQKTCDDYRPALTQDAFAFECQLPDSPVQVQADRDALSQVILNLLSNAQKYSSDTRDIKVSVTSLEDQAIVEVTDLGDGVPDSENERIFEQFHRHHDRLDSSRPGSGLGLTLARQIIQAHQGRLYRKSGTQPGSCFVIELPIATTT